MAWKAALRICALNILIILLQVQLSTSITVAPPVLTIEPSSAITDDRINIECQSQRTPTAQAVYYTLYQGETNVLKLDVNCATDNVLINDCKLKNCQLRKKSCVSFVIENLLAEREIAGGYKCEVQQILADYNSLKKESETVTLSVGDKTPPVNSFEISDLADGRSIMEGEAVRAGTNTTVTCETLAVIPEPGFVVSITGRENRTNLTIGHRVSFHESVPREPKVVYTCEVYNGFGEKQSKSISITTTYGGIASEVTVPKEIVIQMDSDIEVCAIRNYPSQRLQVNFADPGMVQPNYISYKEETGMSRAYVRLSQKAAEVKDAKLEYNCLVGDMQPFKASVLLIGSNMAMMTAGIVIAAILAFLLIVAGIAYALKKRSATPKPQSDKSRYDRVNQNDAGQSYGNPAGRKMMDSNYEPVCV